MSEFHVVNLSGGKDSTAMLILMIEKNMPIDLVISADTGMEFPEMYEHLEKLDEFLFEHRGIHITTIKSDKSFEWIMFERPLVKENAIANRIANGYPATGLGWPNSRKRWCTWKLKLDVMAAKVKELRSERNVVNYIGIAADEPKRIQDETYPLVEWGITEVEALQICYDHGFDFGGVYEIYRRVSCWCCPLQPLKELKKLRKHHPELWQQLREMDKKALDFFGRTAFGQFRADYNVEQLEERFAREDKQIEFKEGVE